MTIKNIPVYYYCNRVLQEMHLQNGLVLNN